MTEPNPDHRFVVVRDEGPGLERLVRPVVAIGNFDGVHRGHRAVIGTAMERAQAAHRPAAVLTFEPHPRTFFKPSEPVFRLTPPPLKARLLKALGASFLVVLAFDREFSSLEPEQFAMRHIVERIAASHVVTGYDFHFGKGRKGNPQTMRELGAKLGFSVAIVPKANAPKKGAKDNTDFEGLTIHPVERIEEAMNIVRGL